MDTVLILMARPGSRALDRDALALAAPFTGKTEPHWLADEETVEFPMSLPAGSSARNLEDELRAALAPRPVDVAVLPAQNRRKRLLVADMDSTFIAQECIDELGAAAGVGEHVAAVTIRAMRGELDFEQALRERVALMAGLPADVIGSLLAATRFTPGGRTLVGTMRASGAYTALVSGGFTQFTSHVAAATGFDEHRANELLIADGKLLGKVAEPILGRAAKIEALDALTAARGLSRADAITVGDGANDIGMLQAAGLGVAFRAKPAVRDAADVRIDHADLTALLYLQGYRQRDFSA